IKGSDSSPWVQHAVSLWRGGDPGGAQDSLAEAMRLLPDEPGRWFELGRLLERVGWANASESTLAKARALADKRLPLSPNEDGAGVTLVGLRPGTGESQGWTVLEPTMVISAGGAELTRLPDGSVLASGHNPAVDSFTVEAYTDIAGITGLRL